MAAFIIIGAILILVLWYFVGKEFQHIAEMKGYYETKYFWWTFICGPIGMLMVIALPLAVMTPKNSKTDELPEI